MNDRVSLRDALARIREPWVPHVVAALNGQEVKLARLDGAFDWHTHEHGDELFLVLEGEVVIELRDRDVVLAPGEMFVVPRGVEHRPVAAGGAAVLLFEPAGTVNTGDVRTERTVDDPPRL